MKGGGWIVALLYLILAVYFINIPFVFLEVPEVLKSFEKWIMLAGGVFLLYGLYTFLSLGRYTSREKLVNYKV